uniref:PRC-barrel domain-containing protein n=1 Tax=Oscillatoriales cyanobacterium SpSt-402 TaxID=2282168 RepID=A0A832H4Y6_9CYAN
MATLPNVVRQSELLNQLVLNRGTMEELGRIEVLWMYPPAHRVLGFVCKAGFLGRKKLAFKLSQVEAIGANGVLTHSQPDETDAERVSQLESLIHCEVWSNAGQKLGKIIDCVFNLQSGAIADYLVVGDRLSTLTGSIYRLPPAKIVSLGRQRVLVAETSIHQLAAYREGIQQKLTKATTALRDEYEDVTQELRSLAKRAQTTTSHMKTLAEQAKERAQNLAEHAREKAFELNEQLLENAQTLAEKAVETGETLVERVQDTTHEWGEQLKDTTQTLTVQAREVFDPEDEDDESDVEWDDIDFLFDEDDHQPPSSPTSTSNASKTTSIPKQPIQQPNPFTPTDPPTTPATTEPVPPTPDVTVEEEDFWMIDEDLTLKRAGWNPQAVFTPPNNEEDWDIEDDPWDITELPVPTVPKPPSVPPQSVEQGTVEDSGTATAQSKAKTTDPENEVSETDEDESWI